MAGKVGEKRQAKKRALLVGVNDYQAVNDLNGCVNDVTNMRHILKTFFGFRNSEIRVLTNARATKSNILHRLTWLTKDAGPGDTFVFHFSGHGSQIRDRDGDDLKDHLDELICPYDMNWDDGFITDDMLRDIFDKLPAGVHLEVFLDCCHSGTGIRNSSLGRPPELGPEHRTLVRYLPPPVDILCRSEGEEDEMNKPRTFRGAASSTLRHVLWAGCRDNQTSADAYLHGSYNGAFTFYVCKHLRETEGRLTRKELHKRVRNSLKHNGYSQAPQLECDSAYLDATCFTPKE